MRALWIILVAAATKAYAQDTAAAAAKAPVVATPIDSALRRAEVMVGDGHAAAGRALVDSMLNITAPGTAQYAEVLFTRASLAATAFEAERDYRRVTVEYPSSPRADDALLRLAQLELVRGSKDEAKQHLLRLERERPPTTTLPRANLSIAHAWFQAGEPEHACAALDAAHSATPSSEVELIHQLDYAAQPCARLPKPVAPPAPTVVAATPPPASTPVVAAPVTPPPTASAPPESVATPPIKPNPPAPRRPTPAPVIPQPVTPPPVAPPAPRPAAVRGGFTVQVAAYGAKPAADELAAKLTGRGLEARAWGTAAPFRVRIGRYPTRAAAEAELKTLKAKQIDGFVVEAEP